MKKFSVLVAVLTAGMILAGSAAALVKYEDKRPKVVREVIITGFLDYAPFGYVDDPDGKIRGYFHSVYEDLIKDFKQENNLKIDYKTNLGSYDDLVQKVRRGEIDILLGAYYDTELYRGLELVYPAIMNNPVTVFMLPHRVDEVKSTDDLRGLKGVRSAREHYSDFVEEQLQSYTLDKADKPFEMFERLFTGKADYILGSQYYVIMEADKLGLRQQIAPAKQTVWKMPMFIGVSKVSKHRKMIVQKLTHYSETPENQKKMEQKIIKMIIDNERKYEGVVPPTFGLEKAPSAPKETPTPQIENSATGA